MQRNFSRIPFLLSTAAVGAGLATTEFHRSKLAHCSWFDFNQKPKNSAFVFIKPHANTKSTQDLVKSTLVSKGITILSEGELTGK
jgi:hypothetical protein